MTELTQGKANAWALRWFMSDWGFNGRYCVTVFAGGKDGGFSANFPAVVDDFGNLVKVG